MKNSNKKKRKGNRRIFLLLLLLVVTGALLSTSSYAWFTANQAVSISDIQVNVEAQNGIQISADGTNWKSVVTTTDLNAAIGTYPAAINQIPDTLEPVSTNVVVDADGKLPMYYGQVVTKNDDFVLTATKETESNGQTGRFVAFDLFFRVDGNIPIYLTSDSGVIPATSTDTGIKNASRIAFVVLGTKTVDTPLNGTSNPRDSIQGTNAGTASTVALWEPNFNSHTPAAIVHARDTYNMNITDLGHTTPLAYTGIKNIFDDNSNIDPGLALPDAYTDLFDTVNPRLYYYTQVGFQTYLPIFSLSPGITKVRMYMWIEGQDVDCENSASGGGAVFSLHITTNSAPGTNP